MATPIDGFDLSTIQLALQANPEVRQRIAAMLQQTRDHRTPEEWLFAGTSSDAQRGFVNPEFQGIITQALQQQRGVTPSAPGEGDFTPEEFERLTTAANNGDQQAIDTLIAAGYQSSEPTQNLPVEQGLFQQVLPNILGDIERDTGRQQLADSLAGDLTEDYRLGREALSPEENARRLQEEYAMADTTAGRLSDSAATSAADQIAALQEAIAAMQGSLEGELGARAAALQAQIDAFTANLDQYDESQREALAQQLTEQGTNLEAQISAQREALGQELETLRGAADTESAARRAALEQEIAGLTAAQEPLSAARLQTANSLATGINLALEGERDRLTAEGARRGYLGGSTFEDAALLRAAIGARQNAASVMGQAREANAADTRTIQARGATEGRTLADLLAGNLRDIDVYGAGSTRTLADALATGQRGIADFGTNTRAGISNTTSQGRFNIGNAGATQSYQDSVFGAEQQRALADALAKGTSGVNTTLAQQQQGARDAGTTAKQSYFDNAYTRGLGGLLSRSNLASSLAGNLTALDNYANTGLQRGLNTLNWWGTNTGTPPTGGYVPVQADTTGNDIGGLGAGLLSGALAYGNSMGWGQNKKTATPATSAGNYWTDGSVF